MIIIDEVLNSINAAMELARKKNDKEVAEKLVGIYSSMLELKKGKPGTEKQAGGI